MRRCVLCVLSVLGLLILSTALVACGPGSGSVPEVDAGTDANSDAGFALAPPNIPWLAEGLPPIAVPMLTPCPEGWHEVVEEDPNGGLGVVMCDPYGDALGGTDPDTCADGWAHFVGDAACTPIGAPCPDGDFPEGLPTDVEVLFVLSSASPGGDGSRGSPFVSITDALNLASAGTVVAVGKGVYDEVLRLPQGTTVWGACAAETRLTATSPDLAAQGVVSVRSADARLANLAIGPAELPGVLAHGPRASVVVEGLVIQGVRRSGIQATMGGRVSGREVSVSGTRADTAGRFGEGLSAEFAGSLELSRVWVSRNEGLGVYAGAEGTSLSLSDAVVHATEPRRVDRGGGGGLTVLEGATATVARVVFFGNRHIGVFAGDAGTHLTLTDVVVRDTLALESDGTGGVGLQGRYGAAITVTRALFSRNHEFGVVAADEGTVVLLTDVVVRDTQAGERDGRVGQGLGMQEAAVTVTRGVFSGNRDVGLLVQERGSLTLTDVIVRDTQGQADDQTQGRGLSVLGSTATVTRALFSRNREVGIFVAHEGSSLTLSDVVVGDTQSQESDGIGGRGLNVQLGATVTVTQSVFSRNRDVAVIAMGDGTSLEFTDVVVEDTLEQESDGKRGGGLTAQRGATIAATRTSISRNHEYGVFAAGAGTAVRLHDVLVAQTAEQGCTGGSCADTPWGVGLLGALDAILEATRFEVSDAVLCGVMVAENGQVDLAQGQVSGSQVGVCLQVDGYSVSRLTDQVQYVGNGVNLDATSLPVPETSSPLADMR